MTELSVLIPARQEFFLRNTVEDILKNMRGDTEIIVVMDGAWAYPPLHDDPRVQIVYHSTAVGQRAAVNEAARMSRAKFVMKVDAHCAFAEGFDVQLMAECEADWTVIPRMYNLHVFDWMCCNCEAKFYQGGKPGKCEKCGWTDFEQVFVWKPRLNRRSDFARFDREMHFQYWRDYERRAEGQTDIADCMCFVGACFFMRRERFFALGGLDEGHGSWGQMGVEMACKAWLSGGRLVVNKKTWFAHLFRTQPGFGFPYPISHRDQEYAREYSRNLWLNDRWEKAVRPLAWMIEKFSPPGWEDYAKSDSLLHLQHA